MSGGRERSRVAAIVQGRMSSRRLPGKVLTDIGGMNTLEMVVRRLRRATELDEIIVATSTEAEDDLIERFARSLDCTVRRGPLADVLGRFTSALEASPAEAVVRVTADCPLVEPGIVDRLVRMWRQGRADYVSNVVEPLSFPKGLNAEVISRDALELAAGEAHDPHDREHVTTFIRTRPERFAHMGLWLDPPLPEAVVTLDTEEDLIRLRALVAEVGDDPGLAELLVALDGNINATLSDVPPRGLG